MLELQLLYGLWIAWPETWTQGSCYPKIFSHTTKRILLTRLSKCLTEINILFSDGFLRTVVLVSGGAWAGVSPHGLYLILVLSHQPTPLAGAHFRTSILAHHLSASWRPFLQTGKGSSDLPSYLLGLSPIPWQASSSLMQGNKFAPWFLLSGRLPPPRIGPSRGDKHHISGKDPPTSSHVAGHDSPESKTEASLEPRFPRGLALHHSVRFGTCSGFVLAAAEYGVKWGHFLFFFYLLMAPSRMLNQYIWARKNESGILPMRYKVWKESWCPSRKGYSGEVGLQV